MPQLEHIEVIEKRLWSAADTLRANSNYASNEYFLPVMGLVFLRHAYSRYLAVKDDIEANLPKRGGKTRALTKEDFSQKSAIFLQTKAQFDHLVALPDSEDRAKAIIEAMESIEADYENLRGVLPKSEYQELDNDVLGQLLRTLNPDELKKVSGDVFGRIYEYFLTQFADQKAHDGGEFFTPVSLVSLIAHVLDPDRGTVLDPACGSGGMFVQSARIVEEHGQRLLLQNPLRTDFQRHYEDIVAEYNREKDRVTIEKTFEALLKLVQELDEEDRRAVREGLDEESLAFFDLLRKPDLNANDIKRVKQVAVELLAKLKAERLRVDHWKDKETTRDAVRLAIRDYLWDDATGLPVDSYTEDDVTEKAEAVFRHVYRVYPTVPSPFFQEVA